MQITINRGRRPQKYGTLRVSLHGDHCFVLHTEYTNLTCWAPKRDESMLRELDQAFLGFLAMSTSEAVSRASATRL